MKLRHTSTLVVTGVALSAIVIGATLAAWAASQTVAVGTIISGSLDLDPDASEPTWFDASAAGSPVAIDPTTFLASAGDTLRMERHLTLDAVGNNLDYVIDVEWPSNPALTAGVVGTYTLTENPGSSSASVLVDSVPLGTPSVLPVAPSGQRDLLLDVVLSYAADRPDRRLNETALTDIGEVVITATQSRNGAN